MLAMSPPVAWPPVQINIRAAEPAYQQLAGWLRRGVQAGLWGPDEPVPSLTWLTAESGLATGTVRRAIKFLVDEGVLYTVAGRGTYVRRRTGRPEGSHGKT